MIFPTMKSGGFIDGEFVDACAAKVSEHESKLINTREVDEAIDDSCPSRVSKIYAGNLCPLPLKIYTATHTEQKN